MRLSRAAAASSAVPVVLSPVTINNYGGTCNRTKPGWVRVFTDSDNPPRPAARAIRSLKADEAYGDSVHRPYLHLVDGGVSDNVGMRGVLDSLEVLEGLHELGRRTRLDSVKRVIVFIVNSLSSPPTNWDESESPPGPVDIMLKSAGTPIDRYSYEAVELLKDTQPRAQWQAARQLILQLGRNGRQQGPRRRRRAAYPRYCNLRHRRVVRSVAGQGGVRVPESAADKLCAAGRASPDRACALPPERSFSHRPSSSACSRTPVRRWFLQPATSPGSARDRGSALVTTRAGDRLADAPSASRNPRGSARPCP